MDFFNSAIDVLQTLVIALGGGLCVWGGINLLEGYGQDNPAAKKPGCQAARRGRRRGADRRDPDPPAVRSAGLSPIKISEAAPVSQREPPLRR